MKLNEKKRRIEQEVPLDPVLLAASVPARKPTAKDLADCKERPTDAIETIGHLRKLLLHGEEA